MFYCEATDAFSFFYSSLSFSAVLIKLLDSLIDKSENMLSRDSYYREWC